MGWVSMQRNFQSLLRIPAQMCEADVELVAPGRYYNRRLCADNVWEIDVCSDIMDEVAQLFHEDSPFAEVIAGMKEPYDVISTRVGDFFAQRVSWDSNIAWVSVDEEASFRHFADVFQRLRLAERFAHVVPHTRNLQLYSSFFVVRTWCKSHNFHQDYKPPVGTDALTLITPLRDFTEKDSFQLTYRARDATSDRLWDSRYEYRKGKAIVFGSQFEHSTEPGEGHNGECHAFLCFTFGTDEQSRWTQIARTLDTQSRIVAHPNGQLVLSHLGREIERIVNEQRQAADEGEHRQVESEPSLPLGGHGAAEEEEVFLSRGYGLLRKPGEQKHGLIKAEL